MTTPTPARPVVGLALGSGAARGAAHVGVLEVLAEAAIECSVIAGSSVGALIGAAYAADMLPDEIGRMVRDARWRHFARVARIPGPGLLDSSPLQQALDRYLGPLNIEDLPRTFAAVAYDLRRRERVLLTTGPLAMALRASTAVPGLFPPVAIGTRLLVDGAVAEPVPLAAARELGADRVIAVSVAGNGDLGTHQRRLLGPATSRLTGTEPTIGGEADKHVLVRPTTDGLAKWSSRDVPRLVETGRQAAIASLDSLIRVSSCP